MTMRKTRFGVLGGALLILIALVIWAAMGTNPQPIQILPNDREQSLLDSKSTDVLDPSIASDSSDPSSSVPQDERQAAVAETKESRGVVNLGRVRGAGKLRLSAIDEETQTPAGEIGFLVFRSNRGLQRIGWGRTGTDGTVLIAGLPEGTVVFETKRQPPYAKSSVVVSIDSTGQQPGEPLEIEVPLGAGTTVRGRVVDDTGAPIASASVSLVGQRGIGGSRNGPRLEGALTLEDGTFELDCVAECLDPTRFRENEDGLTRKPPRLVARQGSRESRSVQVRVQGQAAILDEDLVIPRPSFYEGVVLSSEGRPLPGTLVSTNSDRRAALTSSADVWAQRYRRRDRDQFVRNMEVPGSSDFRCLSLEGLTDEFGRFRVEKNADHATAIVVTEFGRNEIHFDLGDLGPGETRDEITLTVPHSTLIVLKVRDLSGRELGVKEIGAFADRYRSFYSNFNSTRVELYSRLKDEATTQARVFRVGDSLQAELGGDAEGIRSLEFYVPGHLPAVQHLEGNIQDQATIAFSVEPVPVLPLRLLVSFSNHREWKTNLGFEARLLPPEDSRAPDTSGLANLKAVEVRGTSPLEVEIPVLSSDPYWIQVSPNIWGHGECPLEKSFGPFEPGDQLHLVNLGEISTFYGPDPNEPHERFPTQREKDARVRMLVLDAVSQEIIASPTVRSRIDRPDGNAPVSFGRTHPVPPEGTRIAETPVGIVSISIGAEDYESSPWRTLTTSSEAETDLGTILLTPHPILELRIFREDGTPLRADTTVSIDLYGEGASPYCESEHLELEADGSVTFQVPIPPERVFADLQLWPHGAESMKCRQLLITNWTAARPVEIRIPESFPIEVVLHGIKPEHRLIWGRLFVQPHDGSENVKIEDSVLNPFAGLTGEQVFHYEAVQQERNRPGEIRFRTRLPEGRYRYRFDNAFYEGFGVIQVDESPTLQVVSGQVVVKE